MRGNKNTPDGIEIIAREPAIGPHPHPMHKGKMVPFSGVSKLLLADGTETHECDRCGKTFPEVRQVTSHATHHFPTDKRHTSIETVKTVLRITATEKAKAKSEGRKSYQQEAADELNRRGIKTYRGHEWTTGAVNNIVNKYQHVYRIRVPRIIESPTTPTPTPTLVAADAAVIEAPKRIKLTRSSSPATPTTTIDPHDELSDRQVFDDILGGLSHLRALADNIEKNVISLEDRLRQRSELQLDDQALNALGLLRRAWQQS